MLCRIAKDRALYVLATYNGNRPGDGAAEGSHLTATTLESQGRHEIYLDRRICSATPDRVEVHPARSIIFLPLFTLILGLSAFPIIYFFGDAISVGMRLLLTLGALIVVPASGIGLVYSLSLIHI